MTLRPLPPIVPHVAALLPSLPIIPLPGQTAQIAQNVQNAAAAQAAADADAARHAHHGRHRGHTIGSARHGSTPMNTTRNRPPPARAPQPRRGPTASGPANAQDPGSDEIYESKDVEDKQRQMDVFAKTINQENKDDSRNDSNSEEGKRKERHFATIIKAPGAKRLSLPLLGTMPAAATLEAVAVSLLSLAAGPRLAPPGSGVQASALGAARRWMADAGAGDAQVTLAAVRSILLRSGATALQATEHGESTRLWMPAFLLNLHKPRTPRQQEQAADTLAMLERMARRLDTGGRGD